MDTFKDLRVQITDGPSMGSLVYMFKYAYDKKNSLRSKFIINDDIEVKMLICALAHKDKSNQSLIVQGYISSIINKKIEQDSSDFLRDLEVDALSKVTMYYDVESRKGCIEFDEIEEYDNFLKLARL